MHVTENVTAAIRIVYKDVLHVSDVHMPTAVHIVSFLWHENTVTSAVGAKIMLIFVSYNDYL